MNGYCHHGEKADTCYKCEREENPEWMKDLLREHTERLDEAFKRISILRHSLPQCDGLMDQFEERERVYQQEIADLKREVKVLKEKPDQLFRLPVPQPDCGLKFGEMIWRGKRKDIVSFIYEIEEKLYKAQSRTTWASGMTQEEFGQMQKDSELGALVRKMPEQTSLSLYKDIRWYFACDGKGRSADTPEEALKNLREDLDDDE